ncbi:unnamed protein product [Leptosia nina]|uniref:Retinol dehydrogenase 13 n=1 Tax=Leptosia nina TaxID=320188 RepID=A0AAV1JG38_9NEOP
MWIPNLPVTILTGVAATAGVVCLFKDLYGGPAYEKGVPAEGKTIIVTGADSGIGRAASWDFANRQAKVFMACRDMKRCEEVRKEIVLETGNKFVYCRPCDLADSASIRTFVERFKSEEPYVHVLVNNAAVMEPPQGITRDGFETQLGVNYLGHFLLTQLLLDTLKESVPSRVINVTCSAYARGDINKDDLNFNKKYDAPAAYNQSKLANVLFTRELGRRMLETDVAVLAVDPGLTDTDLTKHLAMSKSITRFVVYPVFWPFMKKPRVGAQTIIHAALDPKLQKCKGDFFVDMKPQPLKSEKAEDYELGMWLWRVSEKWTKLHEHKIELEKAMAA